MAIVTRVKKGTKLYKSMTKTKTRNISEFHKKAENISGWKLQGLKVAAQEMNYINFFPLKSKREDFYALLSFMCK